MANAVELFYKTRIAYIDHFVIVIESACSTDRLLISSFV